MILSPDSSLLFACRGRAWLFNSSRIDSFLTLTQMSLSNSDVMSSSSLRFNVMKPPFLQQSAFVTSKVPQTIIQNANSVPEFLLYQLVPKILMYIVVNQFSIYFWFSFTIFLLVSSSDTFTNCCSFSLFRFSRLVLISCLVLSPLAFVLKIWFRRFDESWWSISAVSEKILNPKPPKRVGRLPPHHTMITSLIFFDISE